MRLSEGSGRGKRIGWLKKHVFIVLLLIVPYSNRYYIVCSISSGRGNLLSYPIRRFMFFSFIFSIFSSEILLSVMKEFTIDIEPNWQMH